MPAQIDGDDAVALCKGRDLTAPVTAIARPAVNKDYGLWAAAVFFKGDANAVGGRCELRLWRISDGLCISVLKAAPDQNERRDK